MMVGGEADVPILQAARPARSVGVYVGLLVPSKSLGTMGEVGRAYSAEIEDNDDMREPVRRELGDRGGGKRLTRTHSWRRLKHDHLTHNHNPRLDLLIWIIMTRLVPTFSRKLGYLRRSLVRYREPLSCRKALKSEWKRCTAAQITLPLNDKYRPDPYRWVCTCPSFSSSRFLVCKHLVQACRPVDPRFFHLVPARARTQPFWSHELLVPKAPPSAASDQHSGALISDSVDEDTEVVGGGGLDMEDDDEGNEGWDLPGEVPAAQTFNERLDEMLADLDLIRTVLVHNQEFQD
jgi:hypothetical protein